MQNRRKDLVKFYAPETKKKVETKIKLQVPSVKRKNRIQVLTCTCFSEQ